MCQDTSPFHRVLISQLLVIIVAVELLTSDRDDPLLSLLSGLGKVVLVADCASIVTIHVKRLSASNQPLAYVAYKTSLVTGPFAELALTVLFLRGTTPSTAKRFLIGSVYAKLLAVGALCLVCRGLRTAFPGNDTQAMESPIVLGLLGVAGLTALACAPHIESKHRYGTSCCCD